MQLVRSRTGGDDSGHEADEYVVLGGGNLGVSIARRLRTAGHAVRLVDEHRDSTAFPGVTGSPTDRRVLEAAALTERSTVVVATPRDRRNLLVAGLVRAHFEVADLVVLVNTPDRLDAVTTVDHEPFCVTSELSAAVFDHLRARTHREEPPA